jgi:hypothetical protein
VAILTKQPFLSGTRASRVSPRISSFSRREPVATTEVRLHRRGFIGQVLSARRSRSSPEEKIRLPAQLEALSAPALRFPAFPRPVPGPPPRAQAPHRRHGPSLAKFILELGFGNRSPASRVPRPSLSLAEEC